MVDTKEMTIEEMEARCRVLCEELDANEEENRTMEDELEKLYDKIDALKGDA